MLPYHARHRQSTRPAVTRPSPRPAEPLTHRETRKHENYPALDIFWTIIEIILWVIWIWILIYVFIDIFRSRDLSGWAKALWFLFVLLIPLIGVLVYLIVRGSSMQERSVQQAQQQDRELRAYVQETAGTPTSTADQLAKLADLRDRGVITPEEFERQKAKIMA